MAESSKSDASRDTELTMCDVLQEEQDLEEDANAVLGGSDDTNCSYDEGYIPRQALYACSTCSKDNEPAGICLACCYACHDGHEVVELYTKRNFRCDCGNSKFPNKKCNLRPNKEPLNSENKYNQNFRGVYCSCSRPYPDLEDNTSDEMIQCIMCEDWYHGRHIGGKVPDNEDYGEMVCAKCMESHSFLYAYKNHLSVAEVNANEDDEIDVVTNEKEEVKKEPETPESNSVSNISEMRPLDIKNVANANDNKTLSVTDFAGLNGVKDSNKSNPDSSNIESAKSVKIEGSEACIRSEASTTVQKQEKSEQKTCILKTITSESMDKKTGAVFWPEHWRKELCHCDECMALYQKMNCLFLLNIDDTIQSYEERGKCQSGAESQYDKGLSALSQLDRVKQMEAIRAYTNMKGKLKEYLKEFADNKRTVCESDIKEFFDRMSKRQKLNDGVPHFCR